MPGKYSHSVVLADFSTRGVIWLPPDQHVKYVNSSPHVDIASPSQIRARGTRSAQATYRRTNPSRNGWIPVAHDRSHPSPSTVAIPNKARANVGEENDENDRRRMRYRRYYDMVPQSAPVADAVSKPDAKPAYEPQQRRGKLPVSLNLQSDPGAEPRFTSDFLSPEEQLVHPAFRNSRSHSSLRKDAIRVKQREMVGRGSHASGSADKPAALPKGSRILQSGNRRIAQAQMKSPSSGMNLSLVTNVTSQQIGRPSPISEKSLPETKVETQAANRDKDESKKPVANAAKIQPTDLQESLTTKSKTSRELQTYQHKPTSFKELNFDGFSDRFDSPSNSFEIVNQPAIHSGNSSQKSALVTQGSESRDLPPRKDLMDQTTPVASPRVTPSKTTDQNTPSETTGTSTLDSSCRLRSDSSVSSVSNTANPKHAASSKMLESPGRTVKPPGDPAWRLPEIAEDHGFSPSIFEDKEGVGHLDLPPFDPVHLETTIGQISSGRDVSFDNDAASELSEALPPPINRFKDDEDEFNANMMKMFGLGGDQSISKKGVHTMGRSSAKKSKGFFSMLRSRS